MQIQPVSLPIPNVAATPTTKASAATSGTATTSGSSSNPAQDTNSMFMDLLTAQLKNQSPFDPVDPMQFTSQLVQFNMLDQLTQINAALQQGLGNGSSSPSGAAAISGGN